jgi:2-keto-4-pentenoate hydratase/2-oxohepta-3-ene-1,7-dioic acid hydratase in catechol pathway
VTKETIPDPQNLTIRVTVDGIVRQNSGTQHMVFSVAELIAFVSEYATLEPGDILATGTPAGVAAQHDPPAYLRPGMTVEVEIPDLGSLRNPVRG